MLQNAEEGHIINTSSINGFFRPGGGVDRGQHYTLQICKVRHCRTERLSLENPESRQPS
jgi:hypothetical protein